MGKTSTVSRLNVPGKIGWMIMELPGPLLLGYTMLTLPAELGLKSLPWENWVLAGIFVGRLLSHHKTVSRCSHLITRPFYIFTLLMCHCATTNTLQMTHYSYRAVIAPLINPSMSPIHPLIIVIGWLFQFLNAVSIGGWLAGYGHTSRASWHSSGANIGTGARMELGFIIWALGFCGTIWHDDELREIRRSAAKMQKRIDDNGSSNGANEESKKNGDVIKVKKNGVDKIYMVPQNGLFRFVFSAHYFCEWIEWTGFCIMCGSGCLPARNFLLNEVSSMLPRALQTKRWYIERFGKEKVGNRKAVVPGVI